MKCDVIERISFFFKSVRHVTVYVTSAALHLFITDTASSTFNSACAKLVKQLFVKKGWLWQHSVGWACLVCKHLLLCFSVFSLCLWY